MLWYSVPIAASAFEFISSISVFFTSFLNCLQLLKFAMRIADKFEAPVFSIVILYVPALDASKVHEFSASAVASDSSFDSASLLVITTSPAVSLTWLNLIYSEPALDLVCGANLVFGRDGEKVKDNSTLVESFRVNVVQVLLTGRLL